ncbi:MAG: metal-dependent hydrolase [Hyphomicrobiales bacterium]|nr:MAG: metal-dependent hydrolase [Hyphomicrobiales bacterium]
MKLTWFGHSAFRIDIKDASILIDPFLSGNPLYEGTVEAASEGVTHVVLTHGHDDHIGDAIPICKATGALLTSNFEICMWAAAEGVESVNPMNSGGTVDVGPFSVSLTVAHHSSSSQMNGQPPIYFGNPHGVVIAAPGEKTLYHAGDTDIFSDMALIHELYEPKIGILPIGDRFTMGAKSAALAARRFFRFDTVIPCHYGTFPIIDQDTAKFMVQMGDKASSVREMKIGEAITL